MKFIYQYRTPNNKQHKAFITAPTKEAAYAALKAQGIKPGRVEEAPGFFNKLFGKGKRWMAIGVLGALCLMLCVVLIRTPHSALRTPHLETLDRAQLYGDPVVIAECEAAGWTNVFTSAFDCRLAAYAVPGRVVGKTAPVTVPADPCALVAIANTDLAEIAQMKRMVNGMKRELAEYLIDGGSVESYLKRLDIRQRAEKNFYDLAKAKVQRAKDHSEWKAKNEELRAMGLPMVGIESLWQ